MSATLELRAKDGSLVEAYRPGEVAHVVVGGAYFSVDALLWLALAEGQVFQAKRAGDRVLVVLHTPRRSEPIKAASNGHSKLGDPREAAVHPATNQEEKSHAQGHAHEGSTSSRLRGALRRLLLLR